MRVKGGLDRAGIGGLWQSDRRFSRVGWIDKEANGQPDEGKHGMVAMAWKGHGPWACEWAD